MINLLRFLGIGKKSASVVTNMAPGQVAWTDRDSRAYTSEGYQKNVIVYRCVQVLANSAATCPVLVAINGEETPNHPVNKLIDHPNILQGWADFVRSVIGFRKITGNSYIERTTLLNGTPAELWPWAPYDMQVVIPKSKTSYLPLGYVWTNGIERKTWLCDEINGQCDILHWKEFNPANQWYGMSPVRACGNSVDSMNEANTWNMRLLQNTGVPPGALITEGNLSPEQRKQMQMMLDKKYSGPVNARKPMLLEGGVKWESYGLTPADMDWLEGKKVSAGDIAAAFGVPLQVVPLEGSQTFANYEQARLALYEDTVLPLLDDFLQELARWLSASYREQISFEIDTDSIPALSTRRAEKWKAAADANWLTVNEKREMTGYEPYDHEEADKIFIQATTLPLGDEGFTDETGGEE